MNLSILPRELIYYLVSFFDKIYTFSSFIQTNKKINKYFQNIQILPSKIIVHYHNDNGGIQIVDYISLSPSSLFWSYNEKIKHFNVELNIKKMFEKNGIVDSQRKILYVEKDKIKELYISIKKAKKESYYKIYVDLKYPKEHKIMMRLDLADLLILLKKGVLY